MSTIRLDDAQLAQFTATGIIVIDPDVVRRTPEVSVCTVDALCWANHQADDECVFVWDQVALEWWRKLMDPCPTCDGDGWIESVTVPETEDCPNPDCAGGRQVVTLKATCPIVAVHIEQEDATDDCPHGCVGGVITLGRFTVALQQQLESKLIVKFETIK